MTKFINYPSINQYRNTCKQVEHSAMYVGFDEENNKARKWFKENYNV